LVPYQNMDRGTKRNPGTRWICSGVGACFIIAELTSAVRRTSKRSLIGWCAVSGQAPCSGAKRQGKGLDEVSSAIHGDAVAMNVELSCLRIDSKKP
jgi:hypothetical protein